MPRKMGRETQEIFNGYQPDNRVWLEGPITEEGEDGSYSFEIERLICLAKWTDGRTDYRVEKQKDGRWSWSVMEWPLDRESDWYRLNEGVEDSYEKACEHLDGFVTEPDHMETIGYSRFEEYTDEEIEPYIVEPPERGE